MIHYKIDIPKCLYILILKKGKKITLLIYNKSSKNFNSLNIDRNINISCKNNVLYLFSNIVNKNLKALYKSYNTLIKNQIEDSIFFYKNNLSIKGAGFKVILSKNKRFLLFLLGYSHIVYNRIPFGITIKDIDKRQNIIEFISLDRQFLNGYISRLQKLKKKDFYKGKGLFLNNDIIVLKKPKSAEKK